MSDNELALAALVRRRAQLAGEIEHSRNQLAGMIHALDALDTTIRLFDPGISYKALPVKRVRAIRPTLGGDIGTVVLDALREAGKPVTTRQVADYLLEKRGITDADIRLDKLARSRVYNSLRHYMSQGVVRPISGADGAQEWEIAR